MKSPKFSANSELARYVSEVDRLPGNRTADTAFWPDPPSAKHDKDYMSVNSLELEPAKTIAKYYQDKFQGGREPVALCTKKVFELNEAGKKSGLQINFDRAASKWQFVGSSGKNEDAYGHYPVVATARNPLASSSHCGVEFVRTLKEHRHAQFARRLGGKKFHSFFD